MTRTLTVAFVLVTGSIIAAGQTRTTGAKSGGGAGGPSRTSPLTPWGDPDLQGNWTSEGEYSVPFERPTQFGERQLLTDEEFAERLAQAEQRDKGDLEAIDVLTGKVDMPTAPVPHWREQGTTSRRTSLVIDPPNGRLPPRTPQSRPFPPAQTCGGLLTGDPCDSAQDYGLGVRCIVHGAGFPEAMFPTLYNANVRIVQGPGYVAITYEMIHDTRIIPLDGRRPLSSAIQLWVGDARGRWHDGTLVVETANFSEKASYRGSTGNLRLVERFSRSGTDSMRYEVTATDPATWTAPWTAALDLKTRPAGLGLFEYACHEGNYGMFNMLSTARGAEQRARDGASRQR
jgi:hypothetical protein